MNFQMLRTSPVDLSRYLPDFLFQDESFQNILRACSDEHDRQRLFLQEIGKQMYVPTATWGLADWERIVGVTAKPDDTLEQRRNRILLKLQSNQTSTQEFLSHLTTRYVTNGKATLNEHNEVYAFDVDIDYGEGTTVDVDGLYEAIETYKPAHLSWRRTEHFHNTGTYYIGGAPNLSKRYDVKPAEIQDSATATIQYYGGVPIISKVYKVLPKVVQDSHAIGAPFYGGTLYIQKEYHITQKEE